MHINLFVIVAVMVLKITKFTVFMSVYYCIEDHGSTVVKVLCYKSEGCWFDPSWCQ